MRRFVVMGATSGIGREIALELINEGMYVALVGRRAELLQEMAQQWPGQVKYAAIDVNSAEANAAHTKIPRFISLCFMSANLRKIEQLFVQK